MTDLPTVNVVIPVYRNAAGLRRCLERLAAQDYPPGLVTVTVVDNEPDPALEPLTAGFGARYMVEQAPGSYAARNAGALQAAAAVIAFTDSDCLPDASWLSSGVACLNVLGGRGVVCGPVRVFPRDAARPSAIEVYEMLFSFTVPSNDGAGSWVTANLFTTAVTFAEVGPFNAEMLSGGDYEWVRRAQRAGVAKRFCMEAAVSQPARSTLRDMIRRAARVEGGGHSLSLTRRRTKGRTVASRLGNFATPPRPHKVRQLIDFDCPASTKARVIALAVALRGVRLAERLRLTFGGQPRRA